MRTTKQGNLIRFEFSSMTYIGKYDKSRKAVDLLLVKTPEFLPVWSLTFDTLVNSAQGLLQTLRRSMFVSVLSMAFNIIHLYCFNYEVDFKILSKAKDQSGNVPLEWSGVWPLEKSATDSRQGLDSEIKRLTAVGWKRQQDCFAHGRLCRVVRRRQLIVFG